MTAAFGSREYAPRSHGSRRVALDPVVAGARSRPAGGRSGSRRHGAHPPQRVFGKAGTRGQPDLARQVERLGVLRAEHAE